jgi:hypothetical protein
MQVPATPHRTDSLIVGGAGEGWPEGGPVGGQEGPGRATRWGTAIRMGSGG